MKVTITFNPAEYFSYSFDIEGADWPTIFEQLEPIALVREDKLRYA